MNIDINKARVDKLENYAGRGKGRMVWDPIRRKAMELKEGECLICPAEWFTKSEKGVTNVMTLLSLPKVDGRKWNSRSLRGEDGRVKEVMVWWE